MSSSGFPPLRYRSSSSVAAVHVVPEDRLHDSVDRGLRERAEADAASALRESREGAGERFTVARRREDRDRRHVGELLHERNGGGVEQVRVVDTEHGRRAAIGADGLREPLEQRVGAGSVRPRVGRQEVGEGCQGHLRG